LENNNTMVNTGKPRRLILFDGVCNLCSASVQFVIARDPKQLFTFASLQSETGQEVLKKAGLPVAGFNSFVLEEEGQLYLRSTAALRVARHLSGGWKLLYVFILVPEAVRNWVYDFIAVRRYRWFGRQQSCWVPTPELKQRFLS